MDLSSLASFAGFFVAHGVWSVAEGEALIPMVGVETKNGTRELLRFTAEAEARQAVAVLQPEVVRATCIYDAYIDLSTGKTAALRVEARDRAGNAFTMVVPYRPALAKAAFAVHRPKFVSLPEGTDLPAAAEAFFAGVDSHAKAAATWKAHLDQAI
jgi:hypothetical protein